MQRTKRSVVVCVCVLFGVLFGVFYVCEAERGESIVFGIVMHPLSTLFSFSFFFLI